ncbi:MAG TPA: nucleoside triphosphate pyrophosphohydrolase [Bacteroidales bacterium]|jgi:XTP/dITP diphosphohydrolase|nr:nucleoside triphosphate pyrophosphohydrolase [Bacteroidales bacterium]HOS71474.1 nucleoside triphosphate pyrophosphohydrolase [Bacteroidales bacterium]HQH23928.1 nucleoside triphosphate pyrophosphohydrolase [Bacteroidales bacterium]HQJ81258.1 nucleoside triphosphate pyrophosphohydrolase [Bacteroidales bacterium]
MNDRKDSVKEFERLMEIMDRLRESCPWDKKQTNETLRKLTIEETYELADAIISGDDDGIRNELGDLMLHIVFYAKIGSEKGVFSMKDILRGINEKLIYRHPHVFSDVRVSGAEEVEENWEQLKIRENNGNKPVLSGVPSSLPSMVKANRIQEKVRGVGFDWEKPEQIWDKVLEEISELKSEIERYDREKIESEIGDVIFSVINASRLYGIDPEAALEKTNRKFIKRFNYLEKETISRGQSLHDMSLDEMNRIWEKAKKHD